MVDQDIGIQSNDFLIGQHHNNIMHIYTIKELKNCLATLTCDTLQQPRAIGLFPPKDTLHIFHESKIKTAEGGGGRSAYS